MRQLLLLVILAECPTQNQHKCSKDALPLGAPLARAGLGGGSPDRSTSRPAKGDVVAESRARCRGAHRVRGLEQLQQQQPDLDVHRGALEGDGLLAREVLEHLGAQADGPAAGHQASSGGCSPTATTCSVILEIRPCSSCSTVFTTVLSGGSAGAGTYALLPAGVVVLLMEQDGLGEILASGQALLGLLASR